jgi:hypothetical protein
MTTRVTYTGFDMATSASLVADGLHYYCSIWYNRADNRLDSQCDVTHPNGDTAFVFRNTVRIPGGEGNIIDCPKILVSGSTFVVHWAEYNVAETGAIHRATMDMTAFDPVNWNYRGSRTLHQSCLYDARNVIGSSDFIVARKIDNTQVTLERFDGFAWTDTDWTTNDAVAIDNRVLGIYAHDDDNDVLMAYEILSTPNLVHRRYDADDGSQTGGANEEVFPEYTSAYYTNVSHVRVLAHRVVVVAENLQTGFAGLGPPFNYLRAVLARQINANNAQPAGIYTVTNNLCMLSDVYAYAAGSTIDSPTPDLYVLCGYKSLCEPGNWEQAYSYIMNLDFGIWTEVENAELRMRPVVTFTGVGIPNTAPAGFNPWVPASLIGNAPRRRLNHLAAVALPPPFGPKIKTRSIAGIVYDRLSVQSTDNADETGLVAELIPTNAEVREYTHYIEDPWTIHRDDTAPTQLDTNFKYAYSRAMHQTVKAGPGLFVSGGTPQFYDGYQMVECGFPVKPELITGAFINQEDDAIAPGIYQYYMVARWRDSNAVHRSGPSNIVTVTIDEEDDTYSVQLTFRSINWSLKDASVHYPQNQPIEFELFRTTASGSVFYRVFGSQDSPYRAEDIPVNNPTIFTQIVTDVIPDEQITAQGLGPYQYQSDDAGGPAAGFSSLTPVVIPAMTCVTQWQNRIIGVSALDGTLWISSEMLPEPGGENFLAPEFHPSRNFRVDGIGEATAIASMNNGLYVWSRGAIYSITGTAQSDSSIADATLQLEPLHEGMGCTNPLSVVLAPPGLYFQSAKGYALLDRGRGIDYVNAGAAIDTSLKTAGLIRNATTFEDRFQIRLCCDNLPLRTWITNITWAPIEDGEGNWRFSPTGLTSAVYIAPAGVDNTTLAIGLRTAINALLQDGTYADIIASVVIVGASVRITWLPNVAPSYVLQAPFGNMLIGADSSTLEVRPQNLCLDYLRTIWTTHPLIGIGSTPRASSTASACAWEGSDGELCHVVLQQGGLIVERETTDPTPFADENSITTFGIPVRLRTSWIHVAGFAGASRIRSASIQCAKPNASQYHVDMGFVLDGDYDNPVIEENLTIAVTPARMMVRPRYQKCVAFYIEMYEVAPPATENVRVLGFAAEVGVEGGSSRLRATQIGT